MSVVLDYSVGDNVMIRSEEHQKRVIGCVEEIDVIEGVFKYGLFVTSKDLPKRQTYHEKLSCIEKCVEVLKFKDYVMREQPTEERPFFVVRQYYDIQEEILTPDEPKTCLCGKVVNPDGNLVMCLNCTDLFYHDTCLQPGAKCSGCLTVLKEDNLVGVRRTSSTAALPSESSIENIVNRQTSSKKVVQGAIGRKYFRL